MHNEYYNYECINYMKHTLVTDTAVVEELITNSVQSCVLPRHRENLI